MRFLHDKNSKNFRTKPLYTFLFCLIFIIIPGIILWILFGYINLSHLFLIFPAYGKIASGTKSEIINEMQNIIHNQHIYIGIRVACNDLLKEKIEQLPNGTYSINLDNFQNSYCSSYIAAVIVPYIIYAITIPFFGKLTKLINYDVITFSLTCALTISTLLLTAALPVGKISNNKFIDISSYIILARIVIVGVSVAIWFLISNQIVLLCLRLSKNKQDYFLELTDETINVQKQEKTLKIKRQENKKNRQEPNFVEINEDDISLKRNKK